MALIGSDESGEQSPVSVPASAESARADALRAQFPGGDTAPAILVFTRLDGAALTPADLDVLKQARPVQVSADGQAAVAVVPLSGELSGFALNDEVKALRDATADGLPTGLRAEVTGGPAFGADIANSFAGANITLLAVTALVVAVLLIVTYRSPVLFLVPLAVIGFADRVAAVLGTAVAGAVGMSPDGSTSGITSVLGVRCGHQLCAAADLPLPRGVGSHRRSPRRVAGGGAQRRTRDRGQQRHRRAGPAHVGVRVVAEHPQPRCAGRDGSSGRGGPRAAGVTAAAGAVR